jgi:hypothetical protein
MTDDTVSRATTFLALCVKDAATEGVDSLDHWVRSNVMAAQYGPNLDKVLRRALRDDNDAIIVLLHAIADALTQGVELPERFRRYAARTLRGVAIECAEEERGRRSPWFRNMGIVGALEILREGGVPPTRNAEKKSGDPCGCDIVAEILCKTGYNISGRGVAEVWDRYADILAPLTNIMRGASVFRSNPGL